MAGDGDTGFLLLHFVDHPQARGLELCYRNIHVLKVVIEWSFYKNFFLRARLWMASSRYPAAMKTMSRPMELRCAPVLQISVTLMNGSGSSLRRLREVFRNNASSPRSCRMTPHSMFGMEVDSAYMCIYEI
jgi:hypothetical protein